jgi:hypothetical protein
MPTWLGKLDHALDARGRPGSKHGKVDMGAAIDDKELQSWRRELQSLQCGTLLSPASGGDHALHVELQQLDHALHMYAQKRETYEKNKNDQELIHYQYMAVMNLECNEILSTWFDREEFEGILFSVDVSEEENIDHS